MKERGDDMQYRDIGVLAVVIMIVAMLVIPLPPWFLSFLIIINITLALMVLLTSMNMKEALQFSIFPTLIAPDDRISTWVLTFLRQELF